MQLLHGLSSPRYAGTRSAPLRDGYLSVVAGVGVRKIESRGLARGTGSRVYEYIRVMQQPRCEVVVSLPTIIARRNVGGCDRQSASRLNVRTMSVNCNTQPRSSCIYRVPSTNPLRSPNKHTKPPYVLATCSLHSRRRVHPSQRCAKGLVARCDAPISSRGKYHLETKTKLRMSSRQAHQASLGGVQKPSAAVVMLPQG